MNGESMADGDSESRPESFRLEHRKMPKRAYLLGIGGLVLGLFAGFSLASKSIAPAPLPSASARPLQGPTTRSIPGDGVFLVGHSSDADVRPGLYHAVGNEACAWRTAVDATFEQDSVIASDTSSGDAYVQLRMGEFFDTNGCTTWHRVDR